MKKLFFILLIIISYSSCKSSKSISRNKKTPVKTVKTETRPLSNTEKIIAYAKKFKGVKYKWGGTTKAGMDCSGLIYESFRVHDIYLPRISRDMAKKGVKIPLKKAQKGDLLFFKTKNRRHRINHVGLVTSTEGGKLKFIHVTTSKGVIISTIEDPYWNSSFVEARKIL